MSVRTFLAGLKFYLANNWVAYWPSFRMRHWFYRRLLHYTLGRESSIHMGVFVTGSKIRIGDNVVINRRVYVDGRVGVIMHNNISISPEVYLVSLEHNPNDPQFGTRGGEIVIEDNVWIGARAMILPGIHLGEGAVVAAGAVVTKDVEPYQIVGGVPARLIGSRSREIKYRVKYFPWFDTDIQRESVARKPSGSPAAVPPGGTRRRKSSSGFSTFGGYLLKGWRLTRAQGPLAAVRAVRAKLFPVPASTPPSLSPRDWLSHYEGQQMPVQGSVARDSAHTPMVSVLILTYNNLLLSQICLHSVFRNTTHPSYEVIVVDNGSTDGTPAWLHGQQTGHPNLKLILNAENRGFSAANNQAAAAASGEYLVFLNNDTVATPRWIEGLLAHLQADPGIGMVGPVTNATGNEARIPASYTLPSQMEALAAQRAAAFAGRRFDMRMLAFFCVMLRKHEYDALGGLDERFGVGMFEDEDLAIRYQQRGLRAVCAEDVFIHHFWRASFGKLAQERYDRLFAENRQKFEEKWGRPWAPYQMRKQPPS